MRFTLLPVVLCVASVVAPACLRADNHQVIDLMEMARDAKWEASGQDDFVFGKDQRRVSIVDYQYNVELTDKHVHPLSLSPSDVRIEPQPAPDTVKLTLRVRNGGAVSGLKVGSYSWGQRSRPARALPRPPT